MRIHLVTAALFTTLLSAQNPALTAHPQETLQNGNGNLVPFGVLTTGSFGEGHTMFLVPANELPSFPALLYGIEIHCQATASLTYSSLTLNCGPTTATSLQTTFANNFPTAPTNVLQAVGLTVNYSSSAWVQIPFTSPYVHDGVSALVIEIQKVVQQAASYPFMTMSTSSSPPRTDRPNMVYAFGTPGSGASQALTGPYQANPLSFRLVWQGTPTIRNRGDLVAGPSSNQYGLGGTVTLTMNGPPSNLYLMAAATSFLPVAFPIPGITGNLRLNSPVIFDSGLLDPAGVATYVLNIPNNPALVGFYLAYQGATIDPATVGISLTNGMDHFVNP